MNDKEKVVCSAFNFLTKRMLKNLNLCQNYDEKYKKAIPIVTANLASKLIAFAAIKLEESIWDYRNGEGNFDLCIQENVKNDCKSIFDASTFQNDTR